ncbi:MAG: 4-hydroxybutyrate CoA transferase [Proteobacteria bacterium]|nr:4-hydroxybutyrate CoA transferase [Pseudomonadota bacterium]
MTDRGQAWQEHFKQHSVSVEAAIANINPGDRIWISLGQQVGVLTAALIGHAKPDTDPIWVTVAVGESLDWYVGDIVDQIRYNVLFGSVGTRDAINDFRADFTPWWIWGGHKSRDENRPGAEPIDVSLIRVTPPNARGWCCIGNTHWDVLKTTRMARTVIAVVSDLVPQTFGDTWIHASQIDWFVDNSADELAEAARFHDLVKLMLAGPVAPADVAMAAHVASLVNDGDTVQVGTGSTTSAIVKAGALANKNDLGYFAELTVPGLVDLARQGVINGSRMATHPGKFVTTMAGMLPDETAFIDQNPMFEFYSVDYMHDPAVIARNDNMVAINNALSIDLTGQIAAGNIGPRIWSGTGGQLAYAMGAFLAKGGRSITVLPSTNSDGSLSRIVAQFPAGQIVTVPRDIADIVVTEHGVAHLLNKTQRQRAEQLISIAHPDHRPELTRQAAELYGLGR